MDLFKYSYPSTWTNTEAINGYTSISWIERYREPGEFEIKALVSSGLREFLPLGTVIGQINSLETMIVENHEISEEKDGDPELVITGRSFETYLENRMVGSNITWFSGLNYVRLAKYVLATNPLQAQIIQLINDHVYAPSTINDDNAVPLVFGASAIPDSVNVEGRTVAQGNVHERIVELLAIRDYGIKIWRPGATTDPSYMYIVVHQGIDKSGTVTFSAQTGDISTADYLWSIKNLKNCALVVGKFVQAIVYGTPTGYPRRFMYVDANDIDGHWQAEPLGSDFTNVGAVMLARGRQALFSQNQITLAGVNVSENRTYKFRQDYQVGDIISLDSNFGETLKMRVVEYAEIEDETGESGHPTLSVYVAF